MAHSFYVKGVHDMKIYFRNLHRNCSLLRLLKYSIIFSTILLTADILDWPSNYLQSFSTPITWIITGAFLLILLLIALEYNFLDTLKINSINTVDILLFVVLVTFTLYSVVIIFFNQMYLYKIIIVIVIICLSAVIILIRSNRLCKSYSLAGAYQSNVIDLKDIFEGSFSITEYDIVFVDEKDVD